MSHSIGKTQTRFFEYNDPVHPLALRAEFLVENDVQRPQFRQTLVERLAMLRKVRQRRLIGLPEIQSVGQPRPHDAAIARRNRLAAVTG